MMNTSALLMIASSFLFALMGVCVRMASRTAPVSEVIFFRSVIGLAMIIPLMLGRKTSFTGRNMKVLLVRGITGFLAMSLYFLAISRIPLALAVMLNYTSPLFVAILAPLFLKERFSFRIFLLILIGFAGVFLIVRPQPQTDLAGCLIGLVSGVFAAFAYLSIGALRKDHSSLTIVFYFFWVSTLCSIPIAWTNFKVPTPQEALYLLGTGFLATVAQILMTRAYRLGTTAATSAYSSSIVLFSMFFGMVLWSEFPPLPSLMGGFLIVISVVLISRIERTQTAPLQD